MLAITIKKAFPIFKLIVHNLYKAQIHCLRNICSGTWPSQISRRVEAVCWGLSSMDKEEALGSLVLEFMKVVEVEGILGFSE